MIIFIIVTYTLKFNIRKFSYVVFCVCECSQLLCVNTELRIRKHAHLKYADIYKKDKIILLVFLTEIMNVSRNRTVTLWLNYLDSSPQSKFTADIVSSIDHDILLHKLRFYICRHSGHTTYLYINMHIFRSTARDW